MLLVATKFWARSVYNGFERHCDPLFAHSWYSIRPMREKCSRACTLFNDRTIAQGDKEVISKLVFIEYSLGASVNES